MAISFRIIHFLNWSSKKQCINRMQRIITVVYICSNKIFCIDSCLIKTNYQPKLAEKVFERITSFINCIHRDRKY